MFLVQRAIQTVQRLQGNVHPLLLQIALHLLLSLGKSRRTLNARLSCLRGRTSYGCTCVPAGYRVFVPAVRAAAPDPPSAALLPPSADRGTAVSYRSVLLH